MLKRLTKEMESSDKFIQPIFDNQNNEIKFNYDNKFNVKLVLPVDYPFKPPKNLKINGEFVDYLKMWKSSQIYKYFKIECLCCKSIMCVNNWGVFKTIEDIVEEYIKLVRIYTVAKVFEKLEKKKFPEEIIFLICEYLE